MYSLKLELKLNNKERSQLAGCAGFARFVYNFGLSMLRASWGIEGIKAGDSKRLGAIEKVFTNYVKTNPDYAWMKNYPSAIYSWALRNLARAVDRWRKGESGFPQFKSPSSKMCSRCGNIQPMPLSERVYRCQSCGHVQDRDENASINLENAPSDRVRRATAELTPVDKKRPTSLAEAGSKRQNKRVK